MGVEIKGRQSGAGAEAPVHVLTSPEGAFQARPRPRSFELLERKGNVKSGMKQKRIGRKAGGASASAGPGAEREM